MDTVPKQIIDIQSKKKYVRQRFENNEEPKKPKIEGRRIPETLVEPYDLVSLKEEKKKRFNFKKSESQEENLNNAELSKLKPLFGQCFCSDEKEPDQYSETVYQLTSSLLVFSKICSFRLRSINKIKLIGQQCGEEEDKQKVKPTILKVSWGDTEEESEHIYVKLTTVEQAYFIFSSIIMRKLLIQDFVLTDIKKKEICNFDTGIKKVEGEIYKISKYMRKWEKWTAKLAETLKFYKDDKVNQQIKSYKEIWTRFSMRNGFFIIKMFQGIEKVEIGIPLSDYTNIESSRNWLYLLSRLIK